MSNKISISRDVLNRLYSDEKLSTRTIARIHNCSQGVVLRELKTHRVEIRHSNKEILISKEELSDLYTNKKLSTYKIADIYNCDSKTIHRKLRLLGIPTRPITKILIPKKELYHLYHIKKLPLSKIAEKYSCCVDPIFDRMREYGIPCRTMSEAKTIYPKQDFSGDLIEKAYLIGFRLGDLNVYKDYFQVCVQSNTTKIEQVKLFTQLFERYSKVYIKHYGNGVFNQQFRLNMSFEFLLPKNDLIEKWILMNDKYFMAFLAGYTDAEGNIQRYKNRLRFRIRTYDKNLLYLAHIKLHEKGICCIYRLESRAGKYNQNKDCWSLSVNRQKDIVKLAKMMLPYMKHTKRRENLIFVNPN